MLRFAFFCLTFYALTAPLAAQPSPQYPTAKEVSELLQKEPISEATWDAWKLRLLDWMHDTSRDVDAAYDEARRYLRSLTPDGDSLPAPYDNDYLAWYLLSGVHFREAKSAPNGPPPQAMALAEATLKRSLALRPEFGRSHRNLAGLHLLKARPGDPKEYEELRSAAQELATARQFDPSLHLGAERGEVAMREKRYADAERDFRDACEEHPEDVGVFQAYARSLFYNPTPGKPRAPLLDEAVKRFPSDGPLACLHAGLLAVDNQFPEARAELARARSLGQDPKLILGPDDLRAIDTGDGGEALPWPERFGWFLARCAGFYFSVIALMAVIGTLLAGCTRGRHALNLLGKGAAVPVQQGQVIPAQSETLLAYLYGLSLTIGLVLFYVSIPLVILGLLGVTALLLWVQLPIVLVVLSAVVGLAMAWSVYKTLFTRPASGSFGLRAEPGAHPKLEFVLNGVAGRIDSSVVSEIYLAAGSAIGVHQEGRGPFGIFGVKRRVLTLGLSTLRYLSVGELQAILAHEYAHFSQQDTFFSRFIYQVQLSIEHALNGLASAGGRLSYVNPFYRFLYLYYKSYSLLAAGYSRSREFLADRMACSLYGADVFRNALTKVCTDGALFEMTIYDNVANLLREQKAFVNMYEAFQSSRDTQMTEEERAQMYQKILNEEGSLFGAEPTYKERIEAIAVWPKGEHPDPAPAMGLLENAAHVEEELTKFMTDYIGYVQHLQAQAAQPA